MKFHVKMINFIDISLCSYFFPNKQLHCQRFVFNLAGLNFMELKIVIAIILVASLNGR